jgi:hypothetical protein
VLQPMHPMQLAHAAPVGLPAHAVLVPTGYHQLPHGIVPIYTVGQPGEQVVKKARRMQKNRASAAVSRQRKKQHLEGMAQTLQTLEADKENLTNRVTELETENRALRDEVATLRLHQGAEGGGGYPAKSPPRSAALSSSIKLMACLLCVGLVSMAQGPSYSPISRDVASLRSTSSVGHGRTLKSIRREVVSPPVGVVSTGSASKTRDRSEPNAEQTDSDGGWLLDHQRWIAQHLNLTAGGDTDGQAGADTGTDLATVSAQEMGQGRGDPPVLRLGTSYGPAMFESVRRRPDHSYVFCTEVQMIAAERLADDGVPRMSLIMPTPDATTVSPAKNGSAPAVSLLQVDCSIERSKLVTVGYRNGTVTE